MKNIHLNLAKYFRNILQDVLSGGKLSSCENVHKSCTGGGGYTALIKLARLKRENRQ